MPNPTPTRLRKKDIDAALRDLTSAIYEGHCPLVSTGKTFDKLAEERDALREDLRQVLNKLEDWGYHEWVANIRTRHDLGEKGTEG